MVDDEVLDRYHVRIKGDNRWQQQARLLQSLWRERQGLGSGEHNGEPLGSRLKPAEGEPPRLAGFLTDDAKAEVKAAVAAAPRTGALLSRPRLWLDLLSSQPLCFNVFGPLARNLDLATAALSAVWPQIRRVTRIRFEWSPGHGDTHYTGNKSAFDVCVDYEGERGPGFLGIEVKYHENLKVKAADNAGGRYADIATRHGVFRDDALPELFGPPLQQLWFDHLLALQLLVSDRDPYTEGAFVLLSPVGNRQCTRAAQRYRECLVDQRTFDARRLEEIVQVLRMTTAEPWVDELHERYFGALPEDVRR